MDKGISRMLEERRGVESCCAVYCLRARSESGSGSKKRWMDWARMEAGGIAGWLLRKGNVGPDVGIRLVGFEGIVVPVNPIRGDMRPIVNTGIEWWVHKLL